MKKQLKKVIGTVGGAMAMTVLLAVPTYAQANTTKITKEVSKVYLATNNTLNRTININTVVTPSNWENILAANVSNYAHIRETGSLEGEIVGVLYKGCAATVIEKGPEWSKITSGEVTGYIRNDLFLMGEEAKVMYEETFAITNVDPTKLEHVALNMVKFEEKIAAEKAEQEAKAAEKRAKRKEAVAAEVESSTEEVSAQPASVGSGDLDLLAAIIQCEAGGESYEGKIAVGAVIMNRVNSGRFPDSITDVVYQRGQFTPASSGKLSRTLSKGARSDCYEAAQDVLNGANNIGDCLFFNSGSGKGIQIGNQHFY